MRLHHSEILKVPPWWNVVRKRDEDPSAEGRPTCPSACVPFGASLPTWSKSLAISRLGVDGGWTERGSVERQGRHGIKCVTWAAGGRWHRSSRCRSARCAKRLVPWFGQAPKGRTLVEV